MKLSDISFENLRVGDKVSFLIETGRISHITPKSKEVQENQIAIFWEERSVSILYHSWCKEIDYIGQ